MREFLALVITIVVVYLVYTVFFSGRPITQQSSEPAEAPPPPETTLPVQNVLGVGEDATVVVGGQVIRYGVSMVTDSRCPQGEDCPDPGEGLVVAWVKRGATAKQDVRLSTAGNGGATMGPIRLKLVELEPRPVPGRAVGRNEYRVSLEVARAS